MEKHQLLQGSPEWLAYRKHYNNASDAPAMLGESAYKTRTELLNERKTGLVPDVSSATQKLFDMGHKSESLARPIAEKIIGDELSPEIASLGNFSASFDGITFMGDVIFEHKALNDKIRNCLSSDDLDEQYKIQMEQQLYISGADKCLFMATKWDSNDQLIEAFDCYYFPDLARRQRIIDGWAQFEHDLDTFVPTVAIEMPKAQPVLALPALFIHAKGEITTSNMAEYGAALTARLVEVRSIVLVNDQDFANAKDAAKLLRDNIKQANLAKDAMLSQTVTVGEAARMIDTWCEDMRLTALQLEKDVKEQDLIKKQLMIKIAQDSFTNLINALEASTAPIKLNIHMPNFSEAMKGKSKYDSMQNEISTLVSNKTIEANSIALDIRIKQDWLKENCSEYKFLFADIQTIIFKHIDDLQLLATSRIDAHKKLELIKEAKIKADAELAALAKVEAERLLQVNADEAESIAILQAETDAMLTNNSPVETVVMKPTSPEFLRAVVVEKQDIIASFFKTHNINPDKFHEYRAVIVEFIKHQASYQLKQAA